MTKIKSCDSPQRQGGKCYTSEGAKHSFTSEGGKYNGTTNTTSANHIITPNTIRFIHRSNIPKGRKVTYGSFVVDIKDHKEEKERTRLTVGGDHIEYQATNQLEPQV
jgi:hypothetical protein